MLRTVIVLGSICLLAGCVGNSSRFDETTDGLNRRANSAPRGSDEFCQVYAAQTTANRVEDSQSDSGRGPTGFDRFLAARQGGSAYDRCRAGRTN